MIQSVELERRSVYMLSCDAVSMMALMQPDNHAGRSIRDCDTWQSRSLHVSIPTYG